MARLPRSGFLNRAVIDVAVGVALGMLVLHTTTSLAQDVVVPALGFALGGVDVSALEWRFVTATAESALPYGRFLNALVTFAVVAGGLALLHRALGRGTGE